MLALVHLYPNTTVRPGASPGPIAPSSRPPSTVSSTVVACYTEHPEPDRCTLCGSPVAWMAC